MNLLKATILLTCLHGSNFFEIGEDLIMDCLSKIVVKYQEAYTLVISDNFDIKTNTSKLLYTEEDFVTTSIFGRFDMFVLLPTSTEKFDKMLAILYQSWYWNSRAKFLVVLNQEEMDEAFRIAWKYLIYNIVIISPENKTINLYTFYPYSGHHCAEFLHHELLSSCASVGSLFPTKIPSNLNGCEVKLMPYIIPPYVTNVSASRKDPSASGLEVTIVHTIATKLNLTERYINNPFDHWGYKFKDGTYSLMYKALYEKEIDLIFGFTYGNSSYTFDFDPSFCHLVDKTVWFFPTALQIPQWKNMIAIFEKKLWIVIIVVLVLNGISWWALARNREEVADFRDFNLCLMKSMCMMFQGSVRPPKKWSLRINFFIWAVSCVLIFTAYQCQLVSILTHPLYEKQMETLEDLLTSGNEFGFYPTVEDAYLNDNNWISKVIMKKHITCPLTEKCLNRTAFKRNFAVVKNVRQVIIDDIYKVRLKSYAHL